VPPQRDGEAEEIEAEIAREEEAARRIGAQLEREGYSIPTRDGRATKPNPLIRARRDREEQIARLRRRLASVTESSTPSSTPGDYDLARARAMRAMMHVSLGDVGEFFTDPALARMFHETRGLPVNDPRHEEFFAAWERSPQCQAVIAWVDKGGLRAGARYVPAS
jgi:hypothetical protein